MPVPPSFCLLRLQSPQMPEITSASPPLPSALSRLCKGLPGLYGSRARALQKM